MLELFTSLVHNYKSKIRNPLIGTIASVWIIHNWRIVYSLFNFDKECTMLDKINYINDYFSKKIFLNEFVIIISIAFGVIITTFILLAFSRFLTDGFYKIVEPTIINLLDKNTVFTHVDKKKLELKIEELNSNLVRLRDGNSKLESQNISLIARSEQSEKKYDEKLLELSEASIKASDNYQLLENKNIPANKVINHFDGLIKLLSDGEKEQLKELSKNNTVVNSGKKQTMDFQNKMFDWGLLMKNNNGNYGFNVFGLLFLEYYKVIELDDLPF